MYILFIFLSRKYSGLKTQRLLEIVTYAHACAHTHTDLFLRHPVPHLWRQTVLSELYVYIFRKVFYVYTSKYICEHSLSFYVDGSTLFTCLFYFTFEIIPRCYKRAVSIFTTV